jgi:uncharacterized protein (TIGR02001 family)
MRVSALIAAACAVLALSASCCWAEPPEPEGWGGPFGGKFNANITAASDYSYAGISNSARGPVLQLGLDYRTPDLIRDRQVWFYLGAWGSNVVLPAGNGVEVDSVGGVKFKPLKDLKIDLGYVRVSYPGFDPSLGYNYGDFNIALDYDLSFATLSARIRFSPNSFGNSGWEWNKRGLVSVPLDFLPLGDKVSLKAYGALGNLSVQRYLQYGIPTPDYWYWQLGLVASAFGLDFTVAYTDTSIEPSGCGNTFYCAGRAFVSVTKAF